MIAEATSEFTHCLGYGCPLAKSCERYKATPQNGDRFFKGVPFKEEEGMIVCVRWIDKDKTYDKLMEKCNGSK